MKGFIVDSTWDMVNEETKIILFGRLENGQSFSTISTLKPYFFIRNHDVKVIEKIKNAYEIEQTKDTNFSGEPVTKITAKNSTELNKLASALHEKGIDTYEADIKPVQRFIIDHDLLSVIDIQGEYTSSDKIDRIYNEPTIKPSQGHIPLKIISLDIESDKNSSQLFCIGLYGNNYQKNFMVTKEKLKNTVSCKDEEECLIKFKEELNKQDPDILTGWNFIDFDLVYLKDLFQKHKIPFDIGRTNEQAKIRIESGFFRTSKASVPGRQALDALSLIRDPFIKDSPTIRNAEFESFTLEDVSQEILGAGKLIKGKNRHVEIEKLYKKDPQFIVDYNLQDCKLVYDILEKTKMIELAMERSQLTGIALDKITASIAAFDSLYIREARKQGLVSPTTRYQEKEEKIKGGYVYSEKSGIFNNVVILDFKSLYPSILSTFNIDPASHLKKKEKGAVETPNHEYFKNTRGILPIIIERLHSARELAKKEKRELSSHAIKIIMNSFWGVLASPNCRYFDFKMASAITAFARHIIQTTAKKIEEKGFDVIYSDTDSVFIETKLEKNKANSVGKEIQDQINTYFKEYVRKEFDRESFLELQFAKQYLSFMVPSLRTKEGEPEKAAAKKRYAGLIEKNGKEELEVTGLEAIRGDWTDAAGNFQEQLLLKVFHKEPIENFIRDYIKKVRSGKIDSELVYRKSIRKDLNEYTKTTPPHVKAARQLDSLDSNIIEYYITTEGPEPIQKLKHKLDYDHYIEKQIKPIANQVLSLLGKSFEDIMKGTQQKTLF